MKEFTKDKQLESNLELQYVFALTDKCPVHSHSIAAYLRDYPLPTTFLALNSAIKTISKFLNEKSKAIRDSDIEIYLAWRIWNKKKINPRKLIFNSLCRNKAYLLGTGNMKELHKSGSRIKKIHQQLVDTINDCKDEKLIETLAEIKNAVYINTEIALMFYKNLLENYNQSLKEIDLYILNQKKLGDSDHD